MPKRIVPLTDMKVQKAKPQEKPVTLFDGGGLFLLVTPSGGKLWRFKSVKSMSLTKEKVLQIIRKHLIRQMPRDIMLQDGIPEDCYIYGLIMC